MQHIVYFELYGKKMKATVNADNEAAAKAEIKNKIIFHKIETPEYDFKRKMQEAERLFKEVFGMK